MIDLEIKIILQLPDDNTKEMIKDASNDFLLNLWQSLERRGVTPINDNLIVSIKDENNIVVTV